MCAKASLSGYTVDGTFQQYCIAKAAHVARIPKDIPLDAIAPVLCAGITVYKGLKESGARPGQTVAIVGAGGGLGSLACQYAKAMGLRIIAIDGGDEKKEMTAKLGAESYIDFSTSQDVVKDVQAATPDGTGPHAVLLVTVSEKPFQQAAEYVRPRGTVVLLGLPANAYIKAREQIFLFPSFSFFLPTSHLADIYAKPSSKPWSRCEPSRAAMSETARTRAKPSTSSTVV